MQTRIENMHAPAKLRKYVLTGGTSVGKTTIVDLLSQKGYATFPEFCRMIISQELKKENGILPWKNPALFQDIYAKTQMKEEMDIEKYSKDQPEIFMDRSMVDGKAFCEHTGVPIPKEINEHIKRIKEDGQDYDLVFLLEPLDTYHFDSERVMSAEDSQKVQPLIERDYRNYGYDIINVPFMTPEERIDFILEKVEEFENSTNRSHSPNYHLL